MRIGLLTDTHIGNSNSAIWDPFRPAFQMAFEDVDLILHGGDITQPTVLDWLEEIAPVLAARGNNDGPWWSDPRVKSLHLLELEGWRLGLIHDLEPEDRPIAYLRDRHFNGKPVDIMVSGHTHFERIDYRDGVLQINPGSALMPHNYMTRLGTVGILELAQGRIDARVVRLGETPGMRNPGQELFFSLP